MAMSVVYSNAFGGVLAENRGGTVSIYVPDTQGSTIGLVSSSGVLTDRWVYWPYGEVASRTGTNVTPLTWLGTLGYFLDQVSKLFYVRARHLRSDLARWLTADPLWPTAPAYQYAYGRPTTAIDPSGRDAEDCKTNCALIGAGLCAYVSEICLTATGVTIGGTTIPCAVAVVIACAVGGPGIVVCQALCGSDPTPPPPPPTCATICSGNVRGSASWHECMANCQRNNNCFQQWARVPCGDNLCWTCTCICAGGMDGGCCGFTAS